MEIIYRFAQEHETLDYGHGASQATNSYVNQGQAKLAMCRQFGYLPIPEDRHLIEFWPSLCNNQNGFGMKYAGGYKY